MSDSEATTKPTLETILERINAQREAINAQGDAMRAGFEDVGERLERVEIRLDRVQSIVLDLRADFKESQETLKPH